MAVSEKQRHDLFSKIEETLGAEHAATMMELLPPVGWADVATKRDLDALRTATKADLGELRAEFGALRADLRADLRRDIAMWMFSATGIQTAVVGILLAITH